MPSMKWVGPVVTKDNGRPLHLLALALSGLAWIVLAVYYVLLLFVTVRSWLSGHDEVSDPPAAPQRP